MGENEVQIESLKARIAVDLIVFIERRSASVAPASRYRESAKLVNGIEELVERTVRRVLAEEPGSVGP